MVIPFDIMWLQMHSM